jgi:hypothetical protein
MRYMMPLRRLGSGLTTFHRTHWSHRRPVAVTWFAHHYSSLNSPPERPGPDRQHYSEIEFRPQSLGRTFSHNVTHSVHIQAWETIGSMADAYAILRAIERKYGRIREFRVHRVCAN